MIFTFENNKVELLPEAMTLPEVKALSDADKTAGKKYFNVYIKYIFFVYRADGIYKEQYITSRKRLTCVNQLQKDDHYWKEIEDNNLVKALINWYQKHSKTKEEQLLDAVDYDIEKYMDYLGSIPYSNKVTVETETKDGSKITTFNVEDNSTAKMSAIKNSKDLILYRKELKKLVKDTGIKRKAKQFRTRLFES